MTKRIIIFYVLLVISSFTFGDSKSFTFEDFHLYLDGTAKPFELGITANEVVDLLDNYPEYQNWKTITNGWKRVLHESNGFSWEEFEVDGLVLSYFVTDTRFRTNRGIRVGDSIWSIARAYGLADLNPPPLGTFSRKYKEFIVIQQTFMSDSNHPGNLQTNYYENREKTYSLTFHYDENEIITKIVINQAFQH